MPKPLDNLNSSFKEGGTNDPANLPIVPTQNVAIKVVAKENIATGVAIEIAKAVVKEAVKKAFKEIITKEKFPPLSSRLQKIAEPKVTSYINLYNNHRSVLRPEKVLRITDKIGDMKKYSQIISNEFKFVIIDEKNGINQEQGSTLQTMILESLENFAKQNPKQVPQFLETVVAFKCVKVVCADNFTVEWLHDTITQLKLPWKNVTLKIKPIATYKVDAKKLTHYRPKSQPEFELTRKNGQISFYIPSTGKEQVFEEVKQRIQMCNPTIKTEDWQKLKEADTKKGVRFHVSVSQECLTKIKENGNRLFYLLGGIDVTILDTHQFIECE